MKSLSKLALCLLLAMSLTVSAFAAQVPDSLVAENLNGQQRLVKTYTLSPKVDPDELKEEDFSYDGYLYTWAYTTKVEHPYLESKTVTETVTVNTAKNDLAQILAELSPSMPYEKGGFSGELALDHTTLSTEASGYEEEAKAALLQARRLMAEHKLMPEDIEPQENKKVIQECVGITCTKLSSPWTVYLSTLIAAHYCCRPYRSSVHGSKVSEIGFIGMEDDFKLCKLAFLYAYDCIASRCRQIRTQKGYPAKTLREMCNSYGWGFCRGLSAAFQKQEAEHQEWGLVMVVPQAVEDAVSKMKRSSYKISSTSSMNRQYAAMGYADGQEFDMRRRLEPSA